MNSSLILSYVELFTRKKVHFPILGKKISRTLLSDICSTCLYFVFHHAIFFIRVHLLTTPSLARHLLGAHSSRRMGVESDVLLHLPYLTNGPSVRGSLLYNFGIPFLYSQGPNKSLSVLLTSSPTSKNLVLSLPFTITVNPFLLNPDNDPPFQRPFSPTPSSS